MVWQDIVIALANVLFGYSLIYQVWQGFKQKRGFLALQTSSLTALGLYALAISFFTLDLYISALIATFNGGMWSILFIQGLVYKRP